MRERQTETYRQLHRQTKRRKDSYTGETERGRPRKVDTTQVRQRERQAKKGAQRQVGGRGGRPSKVDSDRWKAGGVPHLVISRCLTMP